MNPYRSIIHTRSIRELISIAKRCNRIDLTPYAKQGFSFEQLTEIAYALAYLKVSPSDISKFADTSLDKYELESLFRDLQPKTDASINS